jgi:arsenate reductase
MAEGLVNYHLGDQWQAYSAGTHPADAVHPLAVRAMSELGIDISRHRSKSADEYRGEAFDLVVTVCDDAAENCPAWLGSGRKVHVGFDDPARAADSDEERLSVFRRVRDEMQQQLLDLMTTL